MTSKALPRLDEDTRLVPLLNNLSQGFIAGISSEWSGADSSSTGDEIRAEMVNDIAAKHYPMCMRHLHDSLRRDKHLKHYARLQYGLFLKVKFMPLPLCSHIDIFAGAWPFNRGSHCILEKVVQQHHRRQVQ